MGGTDDTADPEQERIDALLERASAGSATEGEAEELAMYAKADRAVLARAAQAAEHGALGRGWLARVRADDKLAQRERTGFARLERRVALGFIALGFGLTFLNPVVGGGAIVAGAAALIYSFARARIAQRDPYGDVER